MKKPRKSLYIAIDYELKGNGMTNRALNHFPTDIKDIDATIRQKARIGETFVYELVLHKVVKGVVTHTETLEPEPEPKPLRPEVQALYDAASVEAQKAANYNDTSACLWYRLGSALKNRCFKDSRYCYHCDPKDLGPFLEYLDSVWDEVYPPKTVTE